MALPCDVFVDGARQLCGPALLVPGLGKCGTNALSFYLGLHPWVRTTNVSEVMFDPREVAPAEFVRRHNPGVAPGDRLVWIAKHPGLENRHASVLARRVRRAYPSAAVALALCDPAQARIPRSPAATARARYPQRLTPPPPPQRAFRFFVHFVEHTLRQRGEAVSVAKFAHVVLRRRYNATLEALFSAVAPLASDCVRNAEAERLVRALRADGWSIAPNWLEPDTWDPYGHGVCDPLLAKDMHMDRWVADWVREGYEVNRTLAVVHMEGWARRGAAYVRRLLRLLRLPEALYPWRRAEEAFAAPVFRGEARRRYFKKGAPDADAVRGLLGRQCAPLAAATGERPPWCRAKRGKRKDGG